MNFSTQTIQWRIIALLASIIFCASLQMQAQKSKSKPKPSNVKQSLAQTEEIEYEIVEIDENEPLPEGSVLVYEPQTKVKWWDVKSAHDSLRTAPKKILIDLYTDWCGWCKVMDKKTFNDDRVANYLADKFYPVKFDAEDPNDITLGNTTYKYIEKGERAYHQIALGLLQKHKMTFPSLVFLDEEFKTIQVLQGYYDANLFHTALIYFGENYHKKYDFEHFKQFIYPKLSPESNTILTSQVPK